MNLQLSIVLTLCIIILYLLMIQIFSVLFRITGLTKEKARFQVISLLTNSGYTTSESEIITNNRGRRRLATSCMITGTVFNVLIVSLIINIFFNLKPMDEVESYYILAGAFIIFFSLIIIFRIPIVNRGVESFIELIANKIKDKKRKDNIITVLDMYGKNGIVEIHINKLPKLMEGKLLCEMDLKNKYGFNLLLIKRGNRVLDAKADSMIERNDSIILFGPIQSIKDIFILDLKDIEVTLDESKRNIVNLIDNHKENATAEVIVRVVPSELKNSTLKDGPLKSKYKLNILMLKRDNEVELVGGDTIIEENDSLIIFGPYENIKRLFLEEEYSGLHNKN